MGKRVQVINYSLADKVKGHLVVAVSALMWFALFGVSLFVQYALNADELQRDSELLIRLFIGMFNLVFLVNAITKIKLLLMLHKLYVKIEELDGE